MNVNSLNIVVQILYQNFKRIRPNKKSRPKKQTSRFAQKLYEKSAFEVFGPLWRYVPGYRNAWEKGWGDGVLCSII